MEKNIPRQQNQLNSYIKNANSWAFYHFVIHRKNASFWFHTSKIFVNLKLVCYLKMSWCCHFRWKKKCQKNVSCASRLLIFEKNTLATFLPLGWKTQTIWLGFLLWWRLFQNCVFARKNDPIKKQKNRNIFRSVAEVSKSVANCKSNFKLS